MDLLARGHLHRSACNPLLLPLFNLLLLVHVLLSLVVEPSCQGPPSSDFLPTGGIWQCNGAPEGGTCTATCDQGYQKQGSLTALCSEGTWENLLLHAASVIPSAGYQNCCAAVLKLGDALESKHGSLLFWQSLCKVDSCCALGFHTAALLAVLLRRLSCIQSSCAFLVAYLLAASCFVCL
jgi:hypothetical protein